jgi:ACR3 family arsenite efflux pump ArsB
MERSPTLFLQAVIVLIGVGALTVMLWEPHLEGGNLHASVFQVYFNDLFLACAYAASVPFFVALYQAFILLGHIGRNKVFSLDSLRPLRIIKYCAISLVTSRP